ncbi:MAG: ABC transporter substrate-binding protein [Dechloromonas sp.]|uniref:ABC transporter substrate-binding protein n=1 Tax=Candidatus Dechloromonas phosphorivorans TaxID=2899244 RepID=A0A9D7LM25_9RHOO|nr:ABC transporter substrate-binding protein [Candidatus Dechloromonas phosphorivorans]
MSLLGGCAPPEPLRLGFIGGLTGRSADLAESGHKGALLAVEQANAAGGIGGRKIELVARDDGQNPAMAVRALEELAALRVEAVIGPLTSAMAVAVLPAAEKAGLVMVSPTVTASPLSGKDDQLFKVVSSTREHASHSAKYVYAQGARRVAAAYDLGNSAYTRAWLTDFREALVALGGEVVVDAAFTSGDDPSYRNAVNTLVTARPDAILLIANAVDTVRLLLIARKQGFAAKAIGVTWAATEQLIELGGRTVEGLILTQYFNRDDTSPRYQAFQATYRARFKEDPGFASIAAYDATRATLFAIGKRGKEPLKQALLTAGPYEGAQDIWNFDRFGDGQRKAYVTIVRDGRFVNVE